MEKSNDNLLSKIRAAAMSDELSTLGVRLSVAKNVFSVTASVYFALYLSAVGGFETDLTSKLAFAAYPALLLAAYYLAYELSSYAVVIYAEKLRPLRYFVLFLCIVAFVAGTASHFKLF